MRFKATLDQMEKERGVAAVSSRTMRVDVAEQRREADIQAQRALGDIADSTGRWRDSFASAASVPSAPPPRPARRSAG